MGRDSNYRQLAAAPPAPANDFWRDGASSLPDGTSDTTDSIARPGSIRVGSGSVPVAPVHATNSTGGTVSARFDRNVAGDVFAQWVATVRTWQAGVESGGWSLRDITGAALRHFVSTVGEHFISLRAVVGDTTVATPLVNTFDVAGSVGFKTRTVAATTTLLVADDDRVVIVNNGATNITITLPSAAACRRTVGAVTVGRVLTIKRGPTSTGTITIAAAAGQQVQSAADTSTLYGATTSLNTTNANSATFLAETTTQWGCLNNG